MSNIAIYDGTVTTGERDGTLVAESNPINPAAALLASTNTESAAIPLAVRTTLNGTEHLDDYTITPTGTNAAKWALAPDSGGSPGTYGAWGAALTLDGPIESINTRFWAKVKVTSDETSATEDETVTFVCSDAVTDCDEIDISGDPPTFSVAPAASLITPIGFRLTWTATDPDSDPITARVIVKTNTTAPTSGEWSAAGTTTSPYDATGLDPDTAYYAWVRVEDATDGSTVSSRVDVTTLGVVTGNLLVHYRASKADGSAPYALNSNTSPWQDLTANNRDGTLENFTGASTSGWTGAGTTSDPYCLTASGETGTDDMVNLGDLAAWDLATGTFSVEIWVKTTDTGTLRGIIDNVLNNAGWMVDLGPTGADQGKPRFIVTSSSGGGYSDMLGASAVNDGNWHHVVCTFDNATDTGKVYIDNGSPTVDTAMDDGANPGASSMKLFGDGTSSFRLNGKIAQVRIYDDVLTAAEVQQNYECGVDY